VECRKVELLGLGGATWVTCAPLVAAMSWSTGVVALGVQQGWERLMVVSAPTGQMGLGGRGDLRRWAGVGSAFCARAGSCGCAQ
jgi:hypothetical protein